MGRNKMDNNFQYEVFSEIRNNLEKNFKKTTQIHPNFQYFNSQQVNIVFDHYLYCDLSDYYRGLLNGIKDTYFKVIQDFFVEWKSYYKNNKGQIVFVEPFTDSIIPSEVKEAHFWKNSDDFWDVPTSHIPNLNGQS
jgi:hypothetical protein